MLARQCRRVLCPLEAVARSQPSIAALQTLQRVISGAEQHAAAPDNAQTASDVSLGTQHDYCTPGVQRDVAAQVRGACAEYVRA